MMKKMLASCVALSFLISGVAYAETAAPAPLTKMEKKAEKKMAEKKMEEHKAMEPKAEKKMAEHKAMEPKAEKKMAEHKVMEHKTEEAKKPHELTAQQMKMKTCNARAKGMKGEQRKSFMRECLKKK
ncbi:MAG: PsiF family protein [Candidatus Igneacidithiobacillus chanchocoensis]